MEAYLNALTYEPEHRNALYNLARLLSDTGEWMDARTLYEGLIDRYPDDEAYRIGFGKLFPLPRGPPRAYNVPLFSAVFASGCTVRTFVGMQDHFEAALQAERQILAGYFWNDPEKLGEVCCPVCLFSPPICFPLLWLSRGVPKFWIHRT